MLCHQGWLTRKRDADYQSQRVLMNILRFGGGGKSLLAVNEFDTQDF